MAKRDERPPWIWPRAAYVHVPFCAHHCGYCDFAVAVGQDARIEEYIEALTRELAQLDEPQPLDTLFFGGGTPTHLSPRQLESLLNRVARWLSLTSGHESSVEANPGTLDDDKIAVLAAYGVNRVSLGAQSFDPRLLRVLERDHQPDDVPRAVEQVRRSMPNVSLDLIFGVPGQTLSDWDADLQSALRLDPCHVATYGLTYEKGTRLWKQARNGEVHALDEETELAFYTHAMDVLEGAGFEHYEISNFARPGFRCRHNRVYWANHAYFGFGMGAARYVEGVRRTNTRDLSAYLRRSRAGAPLYFQSESLSPHDRALETAALQLRRGEGVERAGFEEQTGFSLDELLGGCLASRGEVPSRSEGTTLTRLVELGMLEDTGPAVRLTRRGKCLADAVIREVMAAAHAG